MKVLRRSRAIRHAAVTERGGGASIYSEPVRDGGNAQDARLHRERAGGGGERQDGRAESQG